MTSIFALDFDGVVCDSARETGITAWRAGHGLWHQHPDPNPPAALLAGFVRLRPLIETGFESLILCHLLAAGILDPAAPVGTPEFQDLCRRAMVDKGWEKARLLEAWGAARDAWIARDFPGWLAANGFYPGVLDALRQAIVVGKPVYILTTKQERFVVALLDAAGMKLPPGRLFGLESGRKKEAVLEELCARPEYAGGRVMFVEDRLATLERCLSRPALASLQLCLAAWGYNTEAERREAAANPRLQVMGLDEFNAALAAPPSSSVGGL